MNSIMNVSNDVHFTDNFVDRAVKSCVFFFKLCDSGCSHLMPEFLGRIDGAILNHDSVLICPFFYNVGLLTETGESGLFISDKLSLDICM